MESKEERAQTPQPANLVIVSPHTPQPSAGSTSPWPFPAPLPSRVISGVPAKPGWLVPSRTAESVRAGSGADGAMVCGPEPMAKWIVSKPGLALASRRACRSEPGPLSAAVVTVRAAGAQRPSSASSRGRTGGRLPLPCLGGRGMGCLFRLGRKNMVWLRERDVSRARHPGYEARAGPCQACGADRPRPSASALRARAVVAALLRHPQRGPAVVDGLQGPPRPPRHGRRRQGADQLVLRRAPGVRPPAGQLPPVRLGLLAARLRGQRPAPPLPGQLPLRLRGEVLAAVGRPDLRPPLWILGLGPGFLQPPAHPGLAGVVVAQAVRAL